MNRVSFLTDLATAKPKDRIVYHMGNLICDRQVGPTFQNVHAIATAAYEAYDEDRVILVQKRIAPGICAYIAIKRDYDVHLRKDQKAGSHFVNKKLRNRETKQHRYA